MNVRCVATQLGTLADDKKGPGGFAGTFPLTGRSSSRDALFKMLSEPVIQADGEQVEPARHGEGIGHKEAGVVHIV